MGSCSTSPSGVSIAGMRADLRLRSAALRAGLSAACGRPRPHDATKRWSIRRGMAERARRAILNGIPGRMCARRQRAGEGIPEENELPNVTATARAVELARIAAEAAAEKLATDIIAYDVSEQLVITDVFLLCSAANDRQVRAIVDEIEERLRKAGVRPVRREGEREGRWVLLDYLDLVIHIQHAEERTYYALERLWKDCPQVPLPEPVGVGGAGRAREGRPAGPAAGAGGGGRPRRDARRRRPRHGASLTVAAQGAAGGAAAPAEASQHAARYYEQSTRLVLWRHGQTRWNV